MRYIQSNIFIGSWFYKLQGYRKLKEDMICEEATCRKPMNSSQYYLVSENITSMRVTGNEDKRMQTLMLGTLVSVERILDAKIVHVKIIHYDDRYNNVPEDCLFRCHLDSLLPVSKQLWLLLLAIPSPIDKVNLLKNRKLCGELLSIDVGDIVYIASPDNSHTDTAVVEFKGSAPALGPGIHFGLKLTSEVRTGYHFSLTSEGTGLMVSVDKLRKRLENNERLAMVSTITKQFEKLANSKEEDNGKRELKFGVGDRVVWISEQGYMKGSVCWRSHLDTTVRVHLDDAGKPCKVVTCDRSQSVTLPVSQLVSEDEYALRFEKAHNENGNRQGQGDETNYKKSPTRDKEHRDGVEKKREQISKCENHNELGVGTMVEVKISGETEYGVIKWVGHLKYAETSSKLVAAIELEEPHPLACDGSLNGRQYIECPSQKGYFALLSECRKDSRFQDTSKQPIENSQDFGDPVIPGIVEPISAEDDIKRLCGKFKGIQGHNNSCYLDATLFSMFAFTSVFDSLLLRPASNEDDVNYEQVQRVLRQEIVNPLRKNLFVRAERVMKLRKLLDNLSSVSGLTCEEKDPEEFLTSLVTQILKAESFLKLSSGQEGIMYQLFVDKDASVVLPTVQQLFEQSFISSDIKLKQVPSCLIVQMPRFGTSYKVYPRILPSQILDVTDVIQNSPRQCTVCGELAEYECKECFNKYYEGLQSVSFCPSCVVTAHHHKDRVNHQWKMLSIPEEFLSIHVAGSAIPRQYMQLFAVVCIETSHYVAFVKCGSGPDTPWCFFDSMADRIGEKNGYNIPQIIPCPQLPLWLSDDGVKSFSEIKEDRNLPEYAKRLLCDAYLCMYQSCDVMMYR